MEKGGEKQPIQGTRVKDEMHVHNEDFLDLRTASEKDIREFLGPPRPTFEEWLKDVKLELAGRLTADGWPEPGGAVIHSAKGWRPVPDGLRDNPGNWREYIRVGERMSPGWSYIRDTAEPLSPAYFLAELFLSIVQIEVSAGDDLKWNIFVFGSLHAEVRSRQFLGHVQRSAKVKRAASMGGKERGRNLAEERSALIAEMGRLVKNGYSVSRAAERARKSGLGTSAEANRQIWYRHRKI